MLRQVKYVALVWCVMKKLLFDENKNVVGDAIRQQRIKQKLSQQQLAAKMQTMGVSIDQQMISKIENNTRQITDYELACFSVVLQTSPNDLLKGFFEKYSQ